jgi:ParB-like chromosome segregation protein Spo0J
MVGRDGPVIAWPIDEVRPLPLDGMGVRYQQYRLSVPELESAMLKSLKRYGQISPVVVVIHAELPELVDGFKRLTAARQCAGLNTLSARRIETDERGAKAAIYGLNCVGRRPQELEEAWICQTLTRDDGLSQVEVAQLLGRHKSWVCRRLALLERLCDQAREDLKLGLLSPTMGRELVRLPRGNQGEMMEAARAASLNAAELRGAVDLVLASATRSKVSHILKDPREALRQSKQELAPSWDPRLSGAGNRVNRKLASLLESVASMGTWLSQRGRAELTLADQAVLKPRFEELVQQTLRLSEFAEDFVRELGAP